MTAQAAAERLLPLARVAELLCVSEGTLRNWRAAGEGPPSFRIGNRVVYRESELAAWIAEQEAASRRGG